MRMLLFRLPANLAQFATDEAVWPVISIFHQRVAARSPDQEWSEEPAEIFAARLAAAPRVMEFPWPTECP